MAIFKVKTKNKVNIDKKPRVYFTCHPEDFDKHFKKVCDDVFKTHDCAIYYTEDMTEVVAEDQRDIDLGRCNLFVIPVTYKLLTTSNRTMDVDFPYAMNAHIPVLPIMMEAGIDEFYAKPDQFAELQYLNPHSTDWTEISYEEKLRKYLDSVLISDELAKRVRNAFDAYIFLSYRKKDRKYANELMRLIHSNPECRDVAIWFDEFLTPGESFRDNIEKILEECRLFALLVTPRILEKVVDENGDERDNYVISTELPLAHRNKSKRGTEILAVEMEETDKISLSAHHIHNCVKTDTEEFRIRLLAAISRMDFVQKNTPEHQFLIGLAYLDGIDMEVDHRYACEMITQAAQQGMEEAIVKLAGMYELGNGVPRDVHLQVAWMEKLAQIRREAFRKDPCTEHVLQYQDILYQIAQVCKNANLSEKAQHYYEQIVTLQSREPRCMPGKLLAMAAMVEMACRRGNYVQAKTAAAQVLDELEHYSGDGVLALKLELLRETGRALEGLGEKQQAIEVFEKIISDCTEEAQILGRVYTDRAKAAAYADRARCEYGRGNYRQAIACCKESEALLEGLLELDNVARDRIARDLALAKQQQALAEESLEQFRAAEESLKVALAFMQEAAEGKDYELYTALIAATQRLAGFYSRGLFWEQAKGRYEEARRLLEKIRASGSTIQATWEKKIQLERAADSYAARMQPEQARKCYIQALHQAHLLQRMEGSMTTDYDVTVLLEKLIAAIRSSGDVAGQASYWKEYIDLWLNLAVEAGTPGMQNRLTQVLNEGAGYYLELKNKTQALYLYTLNKGICENLLEKSSELVLMGSLAEANFGIGRIACRLNYIEAAYKTYDMICDYLSASSRPQITALLELYIKKREQVKRHLTLFN